MLSRIKNIVVIRWYCNSFQFRRKMVHNILYTQEQFCRKYFYLKHLKLFLEIQKKFHPVHKCIDQYIMFHFKGNSTYFRPVISDWNDGVVYYEDNMYLLKYTFYVNLQSFETSAPNIRKSSKYAYFSVAYNSDENPITIWSHWTEIFCIKSL